MCGLRLAKSTDLAIRCRVDRAGLGLGLGASEPYKGDLNSKSTKASAGISASKDTLDSFISSMSEATRAPNCAG